MLAHIESVFSQSEQNKPRAEFRKLRQIAYTMQTGRIALAYRLVMLVQSRQELAKELQAFIDGGSPGPNTWIGNTNAPNGKQDLNGPAPDTGGPETLDRWVRIAKSWVAGRDVNWISLYGTSRPRRISLPTYPFAKERYWVPEAGANIATHNKEGEFLQAALHTPSSQELPVASNQKPVPVRNQELPPVSREDFLNFQSLLFLEEKPRLEQVEAEIDWVGEIEKHRGEKAPVSLSKRAGPGGLYRVAAAI